MGFIKTHVPCPVPTCKSSDACGINDDNSSFCNSCRIWTNDYDSPTIFRRDGKFVEELMTGTFSSSVQPKKPEPRVNHLKVMKSYTDLDISKASFNKLNDRGLSLDTARYYGVKSVLDEEGNPLEHWYPYYHDNSHHYFFYSNPDVFNYTNCYKWEDTSGVKNYKRYKCFGVV